MAEFAVIPQMDAASEEQARILFQRSKHDDARDSADEPADGNGD